MKTALIILAVVAVLAVAGLAWARHKGYCKGDMVTFVAARLTNKLDLDEAQRGKLDALADTVRKLRGDWRKGREQVGAEVAGLLESPALDRARALTLVDTRREVFDDHKQDLVQAIGDFTDSLSSDQRRRLADMVTRLASHRCGPPGWAH